MQHIDEDTITQAVIARHATAGDTRVRDVMTSLVQHLHAFAREARLTEAEWAEGVRFLGECGRSGSEEHAELVLLSDALGLSTLVTALDRRRLKGATESTTPVALRPADMPGDGQGTVAGDDADVAGESCYVRGRVRSTDGSPIAGARVSVRPSGTDGAAQRLSSNGDGAFLARTAVAQACPIPHDGPVGRLLAALGRPPWRPAYLHFTISAPGHERLVTHVFRRGGQHLDCDAVFGVRSSLVADWVHHPSGRTPDGQSRAVPFTTLDFEFVLNPTRGEKP
ncbi:MAG: dioxygenase [Pseudomonadota bacterium]